MESNGAVYAVSAPSLGEWILAVRPDPERPHEHVFVEPGASMPLNEYEDRIASTRPVWRRVWP
ncbi:MAG: hypothetical protein HY719_08140 [Planctomycetes bacterium]|nr:hypothetical protein [Planctomycetota bacterium]